MIIHKQFKLCLALSVTAVTIFVWIDPARADDQKTKNCYYEGPPYCCVDVFPEPICERAGDAKAYPPCGDPVPCCTGTGQCSDDLVDADCCEALPDWFPPFGGTCDGPPLIRCPGETFSSADDGGENFSPADYDYEQATSSSTGMWGLLIAALVVVPAVPIVIARRRAARRE